MVDDGDDPYLLHAQWYLQKLQRAYSNFRTSTQTSIEEQLVLFGRIWPQVATAFQWASTHQTSGTAIDLAEAFLSCASTDKLYEVRRSPDELRSWSQATESSAPLFVDDSMKANFIRHCATEAMKQSEQLAVVVETRSKLKHLLQDVEGIAP